MQLPHLCILPIKAPQNERTLLGLSFCLSQYMIGHVSHTVWCSFAPSVNYLFKSAFRVKSAYYCSSISLDWFFLVYACCSASCPLIALSCDPSLCRLGSSVLHQRLSSTSTCSRSQVWHEPAVRCLLLLSQPMVMHACIPYIQFSFSIAIMIIGLLVS